VAVNKIQKANIAITKAWSLITSIATGKIKLATIAQRIFNTVVKANPIGLLVAGLTAAAIALGIFSDSADEATEAQENLNKAKQDGIDLDKLEQESIEDRINAIGQLSKEGLKQLLADIEARKDKLELVKREADATAEAQKDLTAINKLQQRINDQDVTVLEEFEVATFQEAQAALDELSGQVVEDTKVFTAAQRDRIKVFNEWIALVEKRIKQFGKEKKSTDSLIELQKIELKQAKALPEATEAQLRVKNKLIKSINEEIRRLQQLGIEKEKEDKAEKKRIEALIARVTGEEKAQRDVIKAAEDGGKSLEELEIQRFKNEQKRLGIFGIEREKLSKQQLDALEALEDEHTDALLDIITDREAAERAQGEKARKGEEARAKAAQEKRIENFKKTSEAIIEIANAVGERQLKLLEEELERIDRLIDASKSREDRLSELAAQGSQDAAENFAFEQRRQAELEAERERAIDRQKNIELGLAKIELTLAAINRYNAAVAADDPNPLATTTRELISLAQLANAAGDLIQGFHEGVDDTGSGSGSPYSDEHGKITGYTHKKEQVWSESDRADVGYKTRQQIKDIVHEHQHRSSVMDASEWNGSSLSTHRFQSNSELINEVQRVEAAIKGIDIPKTYYDYDAYEQGIVMTVKKQSGIKRYHKKVGRLF